MSSIIPLIAAVFKVFGQLLDLYAKNALTQEKLDKVVNSLHEVE